MFIGSAGSVVMSGKPLFVNADWTGLAANRALKRVVENPDKTLRTSHAFEEESAHKHAASTAKTGA